MGGLACGWVGNDSGWVCEMKEWGYRAHWWGVMVSLISGAMVWGTYLLHLVL